MVQQNPAFNFQIIFLYAGELLNIARISQSHLFDKNVWITDNNNLDGITPKGIVYGK